MEITHDSYKNFAQLASQNVEGKDYSIEIEDRDSNVLILAIHGGEIEIGIAGLAEEIAGEDMSLYIFRGLAGSDEDAQALRLHLTSHHFDEPRCITLSAKSDTTLSIHGQHDREHSFVMLGGLDVDLGRFLQEALSLISVNVRKPNDTNRGVHPNNIANRNQRGAGAQIEISWKLRNDMRLDVERRLLFISTIRKVLLR